MTSSMKIQNDRIDNTVNKTKIIYKWVILFINISYFLLFLGVLSISPKYIRYFSNFIQILICIFLIVRFHPFREHYYLKNDATLLFGSALLMLQNLGLTELALYYTKKLEENVSFIEKLHKDILRLFSRNKDSEKINGEDSTPQKSPTPYE